MTSGICMLSKWTKDSRSLAHVTHWKSHSMQQSTQFIRGADECGMGFCLGQVIGASEISNFWLAVSFNLFSLFKQSWLFVLNMQSFAQLFGYYMRVF